MARKALIEFRRDTAANWTSTNPILAAGEPGYETDTGKLKFGDGSTHWTSLAYFGGSSGVASFNTRTGAVVPVTGDYYGAVAAALTGATAASRYVGATTSGHPTTGTFSTGDWVIAQNGHVFICTSGGTPGTWVDVGSGSGVSSLDSITGAVTLVAGSNVTITDNSPSAGDITIAASGGGGGTTEYDYVERSSTLTVTASSAASAQSFIDGNAVTYDGSTRIKVEFFCPLVGSADFISADLWDGSTDLGVICQVVGSVDVAFYGVIFLTPSAASHTFHIKVWRGSSNGAMDPGAGGAGTRVPAWYRVTKA